MIYIKKEDYEEIIAYAKAGLPNEACGLLGGTVDGKDRRIEILSYKYRCQQRTFFHGSERTI